MSFLRVLAGSCVVAGVVSACHHPMPADEHMSHMSAGDLAAPSAAVGGNQGAPNLPASNNNAPARLKASPRHSEWVKIAWEPGSKDSLMAWVVYPTTSRAKTPVVVVVHEIFGLSTWVRGVADQVAADGFIAIAPDLESRVRGGPSTDELPGDSAQKLIRGVSSAERNRGITAAATYAMSQASAAPKYAVIGYCWGGQTVFMHATNGGAPGFVGGVGFYGTPYMNGAVPIADSLAKIKTPTMLLSGSKDARIGAAMPAIDSAMKAMGKSYLGINYEGATHGFLRAQDDPKATRDPAEEAANLAATKDAWPRTVEFLKKNLGVK
ncbi:MAG: dienelactone hydrolase [Gemmatimonadetes bacterium]|nr:dienelactone hydrolase [Gemmatimonadota bacterium]